jgi:hypothetical protein
MAGNRFKVKRTTVAGRFPNTRDPSNTHYIAAGELALNMTDKVLYTSDGTDPIAVGATQAAFQATTITVSDTFAIGDINTSLLLANSSEIFAGNTSVNTTVSTTLISVANTRSNSQINANKVFVGNSSVNAQFNLVGGVAELAIDRFSFDATTGSGTFYTTTPHGFVEPVRGTYVTLYNMTGAGASFSGKYEVSNAPTTNTFIIPNVNYGGIIPQKYVVNFNGGQSSVVSTGASSITLPVRLAFGLWEPITYNLIGGTPIGGLTRGKTYYVSDVVYNSTTTVIKLALTVGGTFIPLTSLGSDSTDHNFTGNSVRRVNGQAIIHTQSAHSFSNGNVVGVTGIGSDAPGDLSYGFDTSTALLVNTISGSTTVCYNQPENAIKIISPNKVFKESGDTYFTYITPSAHGLTSGYKLANIPYPPSLTTAYPIFGVPSTPIVAAFYSNAVSYVTKIRNTDYGAAPRSAIYLKVDDADVAKKILTTVNQPISVTTNSYEEVTFNVTNAFVNPTIKSTNPGPFVIIKVDTDLDIQEGDFIISGLSGNWGTAFNDKQIVASQISPVDWATYVKPLASPPAYEPYRCFILYFPTSTRPTVTQLPNQFSISVSAKYRTPKNLGVFSGAIATAVRSTLSEYIIRIDYLNNAQTSTDYQSIDENWGIAGASYGGVLLYNYRKNEGWCYWSGNWNDGPTNRGVIYANGTQALITFDLAAGGACPPISNFSAGDWVAVEVAYYNDWQFGWAQGRMFQFGTNSGPMGFFEIDSVNYAQKKITVKFNENIVTRFGWQEWYGNHYLRTVNQGWSKYFSIRKLTPTSAPVNLTTKTTRVYPTPTTITVVNSTAFQVPLLSGENAYTLVYGSSSNPITVLSGAFSRNTDIGPGKLRSPLAPPAKISLSTEQPTTGNAHIEYSTYVEVVNSTAAIKITPSTFYNGNSTVNLFSNSSTLVIGAQTDGLNLSPNEISIKGYSLGKYDPLKPYFMTNSSIFHMGGGTSKYTEITAGGIKVVGSEFTVGSDTANVYMNENYAIFSSDSAQTYISPLLADFSGNVSIAGSLNVNGSYGETGKVLSTDGKSLYWANPIDANVEFTFSNNVSISGDLKSKSINFASNDTLEYSSITFDNITYNSNVGETVIITGNTITVSSDIADSDTYANTVQLHPTYISVGSPAVNTNINATSFTGTANNTLYVGSVSAANVVSNAQLIANLANYATTASLATSSVNNAVNANTANNASYLGGVAAANYVNTSGSYTITGVHRYTANLSVNGAIIAGGGSGTAGQVLTSNGSGNVYWSTPVGGGTGLDVNAQYTWSNVQTFSNNIIVKSINANNSNGTAGQVLSSNGTGVYWASVTGTGTVTSVGTANGLTGGTITGAGTISVLANTGIVSNTTGLFVNTSYIQSLDVHGASMLGGVLASEYVTNSQLSSNLSNYVTSASLSGYATTGSVTANAASAYSNATSYVDGKSYVNTSQLSSNLSNYALKTGATFTGDLTTNNLIVSGNLTIAGNTTIINANNLVVLDAVISLHTQANLAPWTSNDGRLVGTAYHYYNSGEDKQGLLALDQSTGVLSYYEDSTDAISGDPTGTVLGKIRANTFTGNLIGTANNANNLNGQPASYYLSTSGSYGTSGQVLTSNGSGVNWANQSGFTNGQSISVNNFLVTGALTANSSNGLLGQVLTTDGNGLYWSSPATGQVSNITRQTYIANGSTNTFTVATGYIANNLDVFINGVKLLTNVEANVQSGSTFTILAGTPPNGSIIEVAGLVGTPSVDYTKYVKTFNLVGNFSAQLIGTARYTPLSNTTLTTFRLTNSVNVVGADIIVQLFKNGVYNSSFTLPAGQYTQLYTDRNVYVTINDYLTVNITQGSGKDFSITMSN